MTNNTNTVAAAAGTSAPQTARKPAPRARGKGTAAKRPSSPPAQKGKATGASVSPKRATVAMLVSNVGDAVRLIVTAGQSADLLSKVSESAASDFTRSAIGTAQAIDTLNLSTVAIADGVKARVDSGEVSARNVYTSNVGVGFHAMTGRFLLLPGDLPQDRNGAPVDPRDVQTVVKRVGQTKALAIIGKSGAHKSGAWKALKSADASKSKSTSNADKGKGKGKSAPVTFASLMQSAAQLIAGASKRPVETVADADALDALVKALGELSKSKRAECVKARKSATALAS